ncbi:MAG: Gfo/Idh/MocA family protein, partial [Thermoplasmata archaeon]
MGQNHARLYAGMAELVGICDTDPSAGKSVAERFGTSYFSSHDGLLEAGVEAVSVATPTNRHVEVTRDVLERGVHALVEKPFGGAVEQAEQLAQLAEDRGVVGEEQSTGEHRKRRAHHQTAAERDHSDQPVAVEDPAADRAGDPDRRQGQHRHPKQRSQALAHEAEGQVEDLHRPPG